MYELVLTPGSARTTGAAAGGIAMSGSGIPPAMMATMPGQQLRRTIIDKTNLDGMFDFALTWSPPASPTQALGAGGPDLPPATDPAGASVFTAIQKQLGLKLESTKGPVDAIVIDRVQKPSEN